MGSMEHQTNSSTVRIRHVNGPKVPVGPSSPSPTAVGILVLCQCRLRSIHLMGCLDVFCATASRGQSELFRVRVSFFSLGIQ